MLKRIPLLVFLILVSLPLRPGVAGSYSSRCSPGNNGEGPDRLALVAFAKQYLGTPYRRAGNGPDHGFDCSGFVRFVFREFHIDLPRSSVDYRSLGKAVRPADFRVGDVLVFYGFRDRGHVGHVGIICEANGMKSRFIHASSGKAHSVTISELGSPGYARRFLKCIDVIGQVGVQ